MASLLRRQTIWAVLVLMTAAQQLSAGDGGAYEELVRRFLIARHCELVTPEVMNGFRIEIMTLMDSGAMGAREAQARRAAAGEAVRQQWRNSGKGAQDPRCRREGRAAAAHFVDFLHGAE